MTQQRPSPDVIRVLHVDDELDFAELTATFLERADDRFDVETVAKPSTALDRLAEDEFDCVVSDYDMPEQNGIGFLEDIQHADFDLPFILFTGKGSEEIASDAISAGVTDYLQKKSESEQYELLANSIRNAVAKYRANRARERHLTAIETADEGISILNDDGEFIYVNDAYADLYGYDPDEMLGEHWELIYPNDEVQRVHDEILPRVKQVGAWEGITTGLRADGTTFVEDHRLAHSAHGELVCTVRDISAEQARDRALNRYQTLVEAVNDPVYELDETGRFTYVNDAFTELVGYDRDRILGSTPELIKSAEAVAMAEDHLGRLLSADGPESVFFEVEIQPKDGEPIPCEDHMGVLPYEGEQFTGSVGVLRDISEHKERQRALERYETIIDALGDPVYALDTDGYYSFVNDAFADTIGASPSEIIGSHVSTTLADEYVEQGQRVIEELVRDGGRQSATWELEYVTADGERIPAENHVALLPSDDGFRGTAGVLRAIGERKRRQQELERQNKRLEEFTGVVSHDLRNPLNVAQGRLELAQEDCDSDHLTAVARAHDRMAALIDNLLTLAREGQQVTDTEPVSLADVVDASWGNVETRDATLVCETELRLEADRSRLQQLLENLIRNAVEHGGADVTVTVGEMPGRRGFYVGDDGPGIPADERDAVFEAGYSTTGDGTGFGLNIVREISEAHGWAISVTESEAGGACFEIAGVTPVQE